MSQSTLTPVPEKSILDRAREMTEDGVLVQTLWLVKNGVPYDIAASLDFAEAKAWAIIFGQFEGGEYDWNQMEWKRRD